MVSKANKDAFSAGADDCFSPNRGQTKITFSGLDDALKAAKAQPHIPKGYKQPSYKVPKAPPQQQQPALTEHIGQITHTPCRDEGDIVDAEII